MYHTLPQRFSTAFSQTVGKAASQAQGLPMLLTEYNAGLCYGGTNLSGLDGAYAAAFVMRQVRALCALASPPSQRLVTRTAQVPYLNEAENLVFYSYWTFTDIFEEGGQLSEPWSNSFGMQTIHQVTTLPMSSRLVFRQFTFAHSTGGQARLQGDATPQQTRQRPHFPQRVAAGGRQRRRVGHAR